MTEEKRFIASWKKAADALKFELVSPYNLMVGRARKSFPVYVPHFGGPKGMLVLAASPPKLEADSEAVRLAQEQGFGISVMNIETYSDFEKRKFRAVLRDWGFYGPTQHRRAWMDEQKAGT